MKWYTVIPTVRLPQTVLTYSHSHDSVPVGSIVDIPVRNKKHQGIVIGSSTEKPHYNTKDISRIYPFAFSQEILTFIKNASFYTCNPISAFTEAFLQPFKLISNRRWDLLHDDLTTIQSQKVSILSDKQKESITYELTTNILVRIITLIRNVQERRDKTTILILVPEQKWISEIQEVLSTQNFHSTIYVSEKQSQSRKTILELLQHTHNHSIIIGTRSSLFLPYSSLDQIIVVDEANQFYIQEQNGLYFDLRELVYIYSTIQKANLEFISSTPSIRLYNFNSERVLTYLEGKYTSEVQNSLNIQLSHNILK